MYVDHALDERTKKKETYKFITYIIVYSIPYYDSNSMFFPLSKQTPNNHKIY